MVISKLLRHGSVKPPYSYQYDADHRDTLWEAEALYNEYATGEHGNWQPVTIVPCLRGVPMGAKRILP
jgi:hypothetical protein